MTTNETTKTAQGCGKCGAYGQGWESAPGRQTAEGYVRTYTVEHRNNDTCTFEANNYAGDDARKFYGRK